MNLISLAILMFLTGMFAVGQVMYETDKEDGIDTRDMNNFTMNVRNAISNDTPNQYSEVIGTNNIIVSFTSFVRTTLSEMVLFGINYGYSHPEYDFMTFFKYVTFVVLGVAILNTLLPLFALIYILWLGITKIFRFILKLWHGKTKKPAV